ncbi:MAG TPA: acyltransferase [Mycobacteriales bacterium]|nr:acyltransferase [Mycobacteriales bacterium]
MPTGSAQPPTPLAPRAARLGSQPALDGIRACAIAAVFALHALAADFPGGFLGVDVFFTLSAFLITSLVLQETVAGGGRYSFRAFYWRRALRLGPALVVWLVLVAGPTSVLLGQRGDILKSTVLVIGYVSNFSYVVSHGFFTGLGGAYGHGWSLAVEEQFYLVWPVLLVLLVRLGTPALRRRILVLGLPVAVVTQLTFGALLTPHPAYALPVNYFLATGHLLPLIAGCLAADLRMYGAPRWVNTLAERSAPPLLIGAALVLCVIGFNVAPNAGLWVPVTTLTGLGTALVILHVCARSDSPASRLLATPVMRWVGQRSYGYYLFSLTLLGAVPHLVPGIEVRYAIPLTVVLSTVAVAASYRWVEKPLLRYKHRFDPVPAQSFDRPMVHCAADPLVALVVAVSPP